MEETNKQKSVEKNETEGYTIIRNTETNTPPTTVPYTPNEEPKQAGSKKMFWSFFIGLIIGAILIGAYITFSKDGGHSFNFSSDAVASVNGEKIERAAYESNYEGILANATAQGADTSDPAVQDIIKEQTLTGLINNKVLLQGAAESGITISDEEVQSEYDLLETQFGGQEALQEQIDAAGLTDEKLRNNIREQLQINAFLEAEVDLSSITVSETEVTNFLATLGSGEGLPPLDQIRPQIEEQIQAQKEQERINAFIETLKGQAEIEILI